MKSVLVVLLLMDVSPCGSHHHRESYVPERPTIDHSSPSQLVGEIIQVAITGDTRNVAAVCDPSGNNSAFAREICAQTKGGEHWDEFVARFATGNADPPIITGDTATVVVKTLPGSDKPITTTLKLEKRATGWYLSDQ